MGMQLIETIELASDATSIEFASIPQDGVDLLLLFSDRRESSGTNQRLRFNNDSGSNYDLIRMYGNGSTISNFSNTAATFYTYQQTADTDTANTFGNSAIYISNYTSAEYKSVSFDVVSENNGTTAYQQLIAATYKSFSPITSIQTLFGSNAGSSFSLYKITAD